MKAVYIKRAVDRVMELIQKAQYENRKIDYVMVTHAEYNELRAEHGLRYNMDYSVNPYSNSATIRTITLENPGRSQYQQRYMQFPRMGEVSLFGVELVMIPEQYHSWKVVQ